MSEQLALDLDGDDAASRVLDQATARCSYRGLLDVDVIVTIYGDGSMTAAVRPTEAATMWGAAVPMRPC